jgi:hypothetical protein
VPGRGAAALGAGRLGPRRWPLSRWSPGRWPPGRWPPVHWSPGRWQLVCSAGTQGAGSRCAAGTWRAAVLWGLGMEIWNDG